MARRKPVVMSLDDYVKQKGLRSAARALGCSAPSILKAIEKKRDILVAVYANGNASATETRPFPSN